MWGGWKQTVHREQAENVRNVHVGCRDEGENAGFSGTQGQPAEFCQEKHGACKSCGGEWGGKGQKTEKKEGAQYIRVGVKKKTRGSLGHFFGPSPKDV